MEIDRPRLEEAVVARLGPFLGKSMASAALVGHCRSLRLESETLSLEQVEQLLQRLRQGMNLFVGTEKAASLTDQLREDLAQLVTVRDGGHGDRSRFMKAFRVGRNVFLFLTASAALLLSAASAGKFGLDPDKGLALAFGALTKLSFLATAAWCALGCAKSIASLAWRAMAAAWICYACGQGCLVFYQLVLEIALPFPSWADLFFVTGSLCLVFALWAFLFELQSSGCPIGWKRRLPVAFGLIIGLGGFALWKMLWPVLSAETETSEKLLSLVYPLTDLLLLIPALLLFQATAPFRGGFIHRIWATMLAGISLFLIGDLLFALMVENPHPVLVWSVDMSYIAGYGLAALACLLQFAVTRSPLD